MLTMSYLGSTRVSGRLPIDGAGQAAPNRPCGIWRTNWAGGEFACMRCRRVRSRRRPPRGLLEFARQIELARTRSPLGENVDIDDVGAAAAFLCSPAAAGISRDSVSARRRRPVAPRRVKPATDSAHQPSRASGHPHQPSRAKQRPVPRRIPAHLNHPDTGRSFTLRELISTETRRHGEERNCQRDAGRLRSVRRDESPSGDFRAYSIVEGKRVLMRFGCSNR
jgi:hypothetical protein